MQASQDLQPNQAPQAPKSPTLNTYTIHGVVTLRSPAYQTSPDGSGNKSNTFMHTVRGSDGISHRLPYISAASVRGLLRRAAAEYIWNHLRERFEATREDRYQIVRETFQSVCRGSSGRKDMKPGAASLHEVLIGRRNVFSGLFGGGFYSHHGALHIDAPLTPLVMEAANSFQPRYQGFCTSSAYRRRDNKDADKADSASGDGTQAPADSKIEAAGKTPEKRSLALLQSYHLMPRDDFEAGGGIGVIENHEQALADYMQAMADSKKARREQKEAELAARAAGERLDIDAKDRVSVATTKNMLEVVAIVPGTQLYFGLTLKSVTPAQLGLALLALRDWANANTLGGGSARGFGKFNISLSLEGANGVIVDSTLLQGQSPFYKLADHETVNHAVEQAHAEIALMDRASLEAVYPIAPAEKAKDDAKPKGKGRGKAKAGTEAAQEAAA